MITVSMVLSLALVGADPTPKPDQKELDLLAGEWVVEQLEARGQKIALKEDKLVLEIKGNRWIFTGKEKGEIVALDNKTNPKCMDVRSAEEGRRGQIDEAIYKIDGDTLTICIHQGKGKLRPVRFETSPELPDTILAVCKRTKKD